MLRGNVIWPTAGRNGNWSVSIDVIWQQPSKSYVHIFFDSVTPLVGMYPTSILTQMQYDLCLRLYPVASFIIEKYCKHPSVRNWLNNKKVLHILTWKDLQDILYVKRENRRAVCLMLRDKIQ